MMPQATSCDCGSEDRCPARATATAWRAWRVKCWTVWEAGSEALKSHARRSKYVDGKLHEARKAASKAMRKSAREWFEKNHGKKG